jgi:hypothetical protein
MNSKNENVITIASLDVDQVVIQNEDKNTLMCFIASSRYKLVKERNYNVELKLFILDDYLVEELGENVESVIQKKGAGFKYKIVGQLHENKLYSCGFVFIDEVFESDFSYLDGKMISIETDRIDVHFL